MDVESPCLGVAEFDGIANKVGKVNDACRSRWAASGSDGGAGLQLILGKASVMVKPMPASKAGKVEIGNVGDAADVDDEINCASIGNEVVHVPAMRTPTRC